MKRLGTNRVLFLGMFALLAGAVTIIIPGMEGLVTVTSLIGGAFIYFIGAGVLFPAATTLAIQPFPQHAGTAGAVLGGLQNLGAGLATLAASAMSAQDQFNLGAVLSVMALIVVFSLLWIRHSERQDTSVLAN